MTVYDASGLAIEDPDLSRGRLVDHVEEVEFTHVTDSEGSGHWETVAEYPQTGGKDVEWVVDEPATGHWEASLADGTPVDLATYDGPAPDGSWDESEVRTVPWLKAVYKPYTEEELAQVEAERAESERLAEVADLKARLAETDYVVIKLAEYAQAGREVPEADAERYESIVAQREEWRGKINELESQQGGGADGMG